MKILIINSSPRKAGNTARLLELMNKILSEEADRFHLAEEIEILYVWLPEKRIEFCRGCRCCFEKGFCPIKDDVSEIKEQMLQSDILIFASPVYLEDVNGIMKNLLDRLAYYCHRPAFYDKYAAVITTSGAGSSNHSQNTLKTALTAWGYHLVTAGKFKMGAAMTEEQVEEQYTKRLSSMADRLMQAWKKKAFRHPTFLSLVSFQIMKKYYGDCDRVSETDRLYWEQNGWFDPHTCYYAECSCNPFRLLSARVAGAVLAKIFL